MMATITIIVANTANIVKHHCQMAAHGMQTLMATTAATAARPAQVIRSKIVPSIVRQQW